MAFANRPRLLGRVQGLAVPGATKVGDTWVDVETCEDLDEESAAERVKLAADRGYIKAASDVRQMAHNAATLYNIGRGNERHLFLQDTLNQGFIAAADANKKEAVRLEESGGGAWHIRLLQYGEAELHQLADDVVCEPAKDTACKLSTAVANKRTVSPAPDSVPCARAACPPAAV